MDYTVQDVLRCLDLMIDDEVFKKHWDELKVCDECMDSLVVLTEDLTDYNAHLELKINQEKEWLAKFKEKQNEIQNGLVNIEDELQTLKFTEAEKRKEYQKLCKKTASVKEMISERTKGFKPVAQEAVNKEDIVIICKLLTGTTFLYNTKNVEGVQKDSTTVPFSFDLTNFTAKDITENLWKALVGDAIDDDDDFLNELKHQLLDDE